tara:strand:+ start:16 stop:915 length:900 start_codon:yes stop_codon:yes gene_type:complete
MELILEDALLSSEDGLVQSGDNIWFHFQKYPWNLSNQKKNPHAGEHYRHIKARLSLGLADPSNATFLKGTYHLGISPHIYSYYHLMTDLLPHLIRTPRFPVLLPNFIPKIFNDFLKEAGFETYILRSDVFRVEKLYIPEVIIPNWNKEKVKNVQSFINNLFPRFVYDKSKSQKKIYISRKLARKRHLTNENDFLELLEKNDFHKVYLEQMSICDQINLFQSASHIIAAHGAGLTNVIFTPSDTKILEIRPIISSGQFCFENLFSLGWPNSEFFVPPNVGSFKLPPTALREVLIRWNCFN